MMAKQRCRQCVRYLKNGAIRFREKITKLGFTLRLIRPLPGKCKIDFDRIRRSGSCDDYIRRPY